MSQPRRPKQNSRSSVSKAVELTTVSNAPQEEEAPRALERALGLQIRSLRRERDLSMGDLAGAAGLSVGMMSKIENGQISPSLGTVQAVASALNVAFTSLFAAFEEKRDCSYVRRGQGVVIERRGSKAGHIYELLGALLGGDVVVEPYLITLEANAEPYTGFRHAGTEFIYMLSGEVIYSHAGATFTLTAGDSMLFDSGAPHGPFSLVSVPMSYLSIIIYPRPPR